VSLKHDEQNTYFERLTEDDGGRINQTQNRFVGDNADYDFGNRLYYSHQFLKKGRSLTLHLNTGYHTNKDDGKRNAENRFYNAEDSVEILNQITVRERTGLSWEAQASYTEPLGKNGLVELEYEVGNRIDDSDKLTYNLLEEGEQTLTLLDTALSNTFNSEYLTHEFELGYQLSNEKYRIQIETEYQHASLSNDQFFPEASSMQRSF